MYSKQVTGMHGKIYVAKVLVIKGYNIQNFKQSQLPCVLMFTVTISTHCSHAKCFLLKQRLEFHNTKLPKTIAY